MINTREGLKNYCLRTLGAPVVQINVADEQLEDRINEAIQYFQTYHYDGITRTYFRHPITQEEIDNQKILMPSHISGVKRITPFRHGYQGSNLFDVQYQLRLTDIYELMNTNTVNYVMTMQHLAMMDQILNGYPQFEFNYVEGYLYLEVGKNKLVAGNYILIEAYSSIQPDNSPRFWNNAWLKKYTTALFKKTWGTNLKKFSGLQIPGGVTIDGKALYSEAVEELKDLEDSLRNQSSPLGFQVG